MGRTLRVAVLVSGAGSTLDALAGRLAEERRPIELVAVIADRPDAPALERARRRGLPTWVVGRPIDDPFGWSVRLTEALDRARTELVVLAGFLSILPDEWLRRWEGRVVNLHPSLLPRYGGRGMYGERVHRAVLAAGDRETGATVHLVTRDVDAGPPIAQTRLAVRPDDTPASLRARLAPLEVDLLVATLDRFAAGELPLPYSPAAARPDGARA